ncbi:hypothetical protein D3C79_967670 [compost metagenome]
MLRNGSISTTKSSATLSMQATTNSRSALNLIRVFHAACNSAATNTNAVASTAYSFCCLHNPCRSELAREKREDNALNQRAPVIIHVHREQARSYRGRVEN